MFSGFLTVAVMINLPTSKNPFGRMVTSKQLTRNCAAEMFGPPLVMPMAHRNRLRQGTMRGLGQVVPPHTGKRLRGCYMMNFSLHPEIVKIFFDPKPMCWCTFAGQPCSHIYGQMPRQRWGLALRSEESLLPVIAQRKAIIAFQHFETNFISGKNRSTRPNMHQ